MHVIFKTNLHLTYKNHQKIRQCNLELERTVKLARIKAPEPSTAINETDGGRRMQCDWRKFKASTRELSTLPIAGVHPLKLMTPQHRPQLQVLKSSYTYTESLCYSQAIGGYCGSL